MLDEISSDTAAYDFVTIAYSIIIGLAMWTLLERIGGLIQHRRNIRFHWIPIFWAIFLFCIQVQIWWSMWGFRNLPRWDLPSFFLILLLTIFTYLPVTVILPDSFDESTLMDLLWFFNEHRRAFFVLFACVPLLAIFINTIYYHVTLFHYGFLINAVLSLLLVSGGFINSRFYQTLLPILVTILLCIFISMDVWAL
jgi:hypothetical protein